MNKNGKNSARALLWPALSILLLVGMGVEAHSHVKPADADPHQLRCKTAIDAFPMQIPGDSGMWYGQEAKQPDAAIQLLHPNVILSRRYSQASGVFVQSPITLLIVDCTDAQDLEGHYPLNCYPGQGWKLIASDTRARTWRLKGLTQEIHGMEYHFITSDNAGGNEQVVYNFFITPYVPGRIISHPELNGAICPDIESVYTSGQDYQRRYFGAAEFQLVTSADIPREQIDRALVELLEPNVNVIKTLMNLDARGK